MKELKHTITHFLFVSLLVCSSTTLLAQETKNISIDSLKQFSRLIGGEWHLDNSYQIFEWGVGKTSVKSKSYFILNGKAKLVSEGIWVWHLGEKKIKGYFTAIEMPVVFFDYTTSFKKNQMVNELISYSPEGKPEIYFETWEFTDDDHFVWTLFSKTDDGEKKIMGGNYVRKYSSQVKE
jgi:hypothetical protein